MKNNYIFEIFEQPDDDHPYTKYYWYRIYKNGAPYLESEGNMFEAIQEAKYAASGHIALLKKEEDKCL
jgi:hypothetical protein